MLQLREDGGDLLFRRNTEQDCKHVRILSDGATLPIADVANTSIAIEQHVVDCIPERFSAGAILYCLIVLSERVGQVGAIDEYAIIQCVERRQRA